MNRRSSLIVGSAHAALDLPIFVESEADKYAPLVTSIRDKVVTLLGSALDHPDARRLLGHFAVVHGEWSLAADRYATAVAEGDATAVALEIEARLHEASGGDKGSEITLLRQQLTMGDRAAAMAMLRLDALEPLVPDGALLLPTAIGEQLVAEACHNLLSSTEGFGALEYRDADAAVLSREAELGLPGAVRHLCEQALANSSPEVVEAAIHYATGHDVDVDREAMPWWTASMPFSGTVGRLLLSGIEVGTFAAIAELTRLRFLAGDDSDEWGSEPIQAAVRETQSLLTFTDDEWDLLTASTHGRDLMLMQSLAAWSRGDMDALAAVRILLHSNHTSGQYADHVGSLLRSESEGNSLAWAVLGESLVATASADIEARHLVGSLQTPLMTGFPHEHPGTQDAAVDGTEVLARLEETALSRRVSEVLDELCVDHLAVDDWTLQINKIPPFGMSVNCRFLRDDSHGQLAYIYTNVVTAIPDGVQVPWQLAPEDEDADLLAPCPWALEEMPARNGLFVKILEALVRYSELISKDQYGTPLYRMGLTLGQQMGRKVRFNGGEAVAWEIAQAMSGDVEVTADLPRPVATVVREPWTPLDGPNGAGAYAHKLQIGYLVDGALEGPRLRDAVDGCLSSLTDLMDHCESLWDDNEELFLEFIWGMPTVNVLQHMRLWLEGAGGTVDEMDEREVSAALRRVAGDSRLSARNVASGMYMNNVALELHGEGLDRGSVNLFMAAAACATPEAQASLGWMLLSLNLPESALLAHQLFRPRLDDAVALREAGDGIESEWRLLEVPMDQPWRSRTRVAGLDDLEALTLVSAEEFRSAIENVDSNAGLIHHALGDVPARDQAWALASSSGRPETAIYKAGAQVLAGATPAMAFTNSGLTREQAEGEASTIAEVRSWGLPSLEGLMSACVSIIDASRVSR